MVGGENVMSNDVAGLLNRWWLLGWWGAGAGLGVVSEFAGQTDVPW